MKRFLLFSSAVFLSFPADAQVPESGEINFEILRDGSSFGEHRVRFEEDGGQTRVLIDIEMVYRLGPIALFRYEHSNEEIWRGDKIISMTSQTNDDGDDYVVNAIWGDVLSVEVSKEGEESAFDAPVDLYTTSYWHPSTLKATQLLNTQKGIIEDVTVTSAGREELPTQNGVIEADKYLIDASLPLEVWYEAGTQIWSGLRFDVRGSTIEYRRID